MPTTSMRADIALPLLQVVFLRASWYILAERQPVPATAEQVARRLGPGGECEQRGLRFDRLLFPSPLPVASAPRGYGRQSCTLVVSMHVSIEATETPASGDAVFPTLGALGCTTSAWRLWGSVRAGRGFKAISRYRGDVYVLIYRCPIGQREADSTQ